MAEKQGINNEIMGIPFPCILDNNSSHYYQGKSTSRFTEMHGFLWNKEIKERRGSYRQPVEARVDISHSTFGTLHGLTRDISDTGMFITLKQVPRLPKGAHLRVVLPDSANPNIIFNMRVARSNDDGIGLVFVDYEQDGTRYDMETLLSELRKKAARSTSQKG